MACLQSMAHVVRLGCSLQGFQNRRRPTLLPLPLAARASLSVVLGLWNPGEELCSQDPYFLFVCLFGSCSGLS